MNLKRRLFMAVLCGALCLTGLAGCGMVRDATSDAASKTGEVISDAGRGVSEGVSRAESSVSSALDRNDGNVDSGRDGWIDEDGEDRTVSDFAEEHRNSSVSPAR